MRVHAVRDAGVHKPYHGASFDRAGEFVAGVVEDFVLLGISDDGDFAGHLVEPGYHRHSCMPVN